MAHWSRSLNFMIFETHGHPLFDSDSFFSFFYRSYVQLLLFMCNFFLSAKKVFINKYRGLRYTQIEYTNKEKKYLSKSIYSNDLGS